MDKFKGYLILNKQIVIGGGRPVTIWIDHDKLNMEDFHKKFTYEIDINKTTFNIQTTLATEPFHPRLIFYINFKLEDNDVFLESNSLNKQFISALAKNEKILEFIPMILS